LDNGLDQKHEIISVHTREKKQEDEKVKQQKKDEKTQQFIDEVKTMVKWMSPPGDEKCIDIKGEMWAPYQEIKNRREDDRSHLAPGDTITDAGIQHVTASASQKEAAGTGDKDSSDSAAHALVVAKCRKQNWKQKAVPV
jgi:hypothetical protein